MQSPINQITELIGGTELSDSTVKFLTFCSAVYCLATSLQFRCERPESNFYSEFSSVFPFVFLVGSTQYVRLFTLTNEAESTKRTDETSYTCPCTRLKAYRGSRGIALLILNLGTSWRRVDNLTPLVSINKSFCGPQRRPGHYVDDKKTMLSLVTFELLTTQPVH